MTVKILKDGIKEFSGVYNLNIEFIDVNTSCVNTYLREKEKNLELVVQVPKKESFSEEMAESISSAVISFIKKTKVKKVMMDTDQIHLEKSVKLSVLKKIVLDSYEFKRYKTNFENEEQSLFLKISEDDKEYFSSIENLMEIKKNVRDLINTPANGMTPKDFAEIAYQLSLKYDFDIEVLDEDDIIELNMNGVHSVGKGSINRPKILILRYNGNPESDQIFGLVGKGITFDSGGYSLKSTPSMVNMKNDMGGAAISLGAFCGAVNEKCRVNLVCVIPLCENLISDRAYKPGDIIKTMSGLTVEIENTDCEGRVVLSDAIYYISVKERVTKFLTIATLTGGAYNTFGEFMTPVFSNDDRFFQEVLLSSEETGEKIWRMPLEKMYRKGITGNVADLKNAGPKVGGMITSALFLNEFNGTGVPWCHFDIAGSVIGSDDKLATGKTLELLYNLIKKQEKGE